MLNAASPPRDPAALPRLLLTLAALLLLWPGLRLSELDIPGLFSGDNARTMGGFLAGFWPLAHDPEFLARRAAACRPGGHGHCAGRCAAC